MPTSLTFKTISSPVGVLKLVAAESALIAILWENDDPTRVPMTEDLRHPVLLETEHQLNEYFSGKRQSFSIKLGFTGTEFQQAVWHALLTIPYGETRSYGQIARQIGHPKAVRTVGTAIGKNPIAIIVPCHRVIGANGKLTGFAGGLATKTILLDLEASNPDSPRFY
ncbi:MAG: methylated-DNA--[protein]-cysteine S-methyltransferase [Verrucomicrobiota bacterium]